MSHIHQVFPGRRRMAWPVGRLLTVIFLSLCPAAQAHDLFTNYVQHTAQLLVGSRHLDLTLDLTFFEKWSARERQVMDKDGNGRISRAEQEAYLRQLAAHLSESVTVRVAGQELAVTPLYEPELDLMAHAETDLGHHRLRLCFFAPTPARLRAEDEIVVEDHLWPEAKFLGATQAEGRDGCKLSAEIFRPPAGAPAAAEPTRQFTYRCLKPPVAKDAAAKPTVP